MRREWTLAAMLCVIPVVAAAQTPDTEIWVAPLRHLERTLAIGEPRNVTSRPGYDNQPWFVPGADAILYVSERAGETDVFRLDLATGAETQLTHTPEREYSPTLTADGGTMLVVRWAADMSEGHLWRYSPLGEPIGVAVGDVPRIGYYAFGDDHTMAIFVNDSAQSFYLADAVSGKTERVGEGLGGSPPRGIPGQKAVSFLRQSADGDWWIVRLDLETRETTPLVRAISGQTQYAWTPDATLLMPNGNSIYAWHPAHGGDWQRIASFGAPGLEEISRIAVSPAGDKVAMVATVRQP